MSSNGMQRQVVEDHKIQVMFMFLFIFFIIFFFYFSFRISCSSWYVIMSVTEKRMYWMRAKEACMKIIENTDQKKLREIMSSKLRKSGEGRETNPATLLEALRIRFHRRQICWRCYERRTSWQSNPLQGAIITHARRTMAVAYHRNR